MSEAPPSPGISLWKVLLPVAVIIALAVGSAYWVMKHAPEAPEGAPASGEQVTDFTLERLGDGARIKVSEIGAKVLIVNFWATWCEACVVEMPSMVRLRERYRGRGLEVAFVDVDENPEQVVPKLLEMLEIDFPTYVDREGQLTDLFKVRGIPKTVVLDRNRKILFTHDGDKDWDTSSVHARIEEWLST